MSREVEMNESMLQQNNLNNQNKTGIRYCCISRKTTILAEIVPQAIERNSEEISRMSQECERVLDNIFSESYSSNFIILTSMNQTFFSMVDEQTSIVLLCVAQGTLSRSQGMQFLNDLKDLVNHFASQEQLQKAGHKQLTSLLKSHIQILISEFQTKYVNQPGKFDAIKTDISQAKEKLVESVELLMIRGEKLNRLYDEVGQLKEVAIDFRRSAGDLEQSFCKRNMKYFIWGAVACGVIVLGIILIVVFI